MIDNKFNFRVIKLGTIVLPVVYENRNKKWINFGNDNMYPQYLVELSHKTGLHTAILDKKVKVGIGNGWEYEGPTNKKTEDFIKKCNPYESLNDVLLKCYKDLEIFGGFYLQPLLNSAGGLVELYHTPFENIRTSQLNDKGIIPEFYYYEDWKPYISNHKKIDVIPAYDTKKSKSLYYSKIYTVGNRYYPLPSYVGATTDIETLAAISYYHNSNLKNNFQPGSIFILKPGAQATEEEINQMIDNIEDQVGVEGTGSVIVIAKDSRDETPEFTQFDISDIDKQFEQLSKSVKENIVTAHNATRVVAGLEQVGSLGGSKEHAEASQIFYDDYIKPNQKFVENRFNDLLSKYGFKELYIDNDIRNPYMYDIDLLNEGLTRDEIREILGYDALPEQEIVVEQEPIEDKKEITEDE